MKDDGVNSDGSEVALASCIMERRQSKEVQCVGCSI